MLLFKPGQCNALFHRATQEVICGHKWEAADTGTGWTWTDRQMDVSHRTLGRHQSPSHITGHFLASKPAFDLEFVIYHHNHGEREEAQQAVSWWGGGEIFLNVAFLQCFEGSQPGEMHVPRLWLCTLNLPEKKTPNPSCKHWSMARWWKSHNCNNMLVLLLLSSCLVTLVHFKEKKYESNHLNITLSQTKNIPYSLEK